LPLPPQALVCLTDLLNSILMLLAAVAFAGGSVLVLIGVGLAITEWALPVEGLKILLAPAVGLAVLDLGFQWATFFVPAYVALLIVVVISFPAAAWTLWRRRGVLFTMDQARKFITGTGKARMWQYDRVPDYMRPQRIIDGIRALGVDVSGWGE